MDGRWAPMWETERDAAGMPVRMVLAGWYRPIGAHRRERVAREAKQHAIERAAAADARQERLL